ncbi:hypothetical protein BDZ45DRAFT_663652 [Acephala macrosclerotiorum]|nr:hypothetical protein BDZ45DRAFT_663652 [Acephala macrosclerotiorum]
MEPEPFITLSVGGMQLPAPLPSPDSSSSESQSEHDSSPTSSISKDDDSVDGLSLADDSSFTSATHDTSRTKYHMRDLSIFAKHLEHAAASSFPNKGQPRYQSVRVLLLRWEEDGIGVKQELDSLANTFQHYGFDTKTWLIPTVKSHNLLMKKALQVLDDYGRPDSLLIVYYAGHGRMNASRQAEWTCMVDNKLISLQWHAVQTLFEDADSDVLLLLDCCAAASGALTGIDSNNNNVTETIAACGFETWAPLPGRHSFTETMTTVLNEWYHRPAFIAAMLHCEILNRLRHEKPEYRGPRKFEYRKSPIHVLGTNDSKARSVELVPRRPENLDTESSASSTIPDPYSMDSLTKVLDNGDFSIPHVLISLALEEEQLLDVRQCKKWLQDFPALAKFVTVQGAYRSNSTLLLLSIPVSVWDMLPEDPACVFIGYVHSRSLLDQSQVPKFSIHRTDLPFLSSNEVCPQTRTDPTRFRPWKAYVWLVWLSWGLFITIILAQAVANRNNDPEVSIDKLFSKLVNEVLFSNSTPYLEMERKY